MLNKIARRLLPIKVRQALGGWSLTHLSFNKIVLSLYTLLLSGYTVTNLDLLPNGKAVYNYKGYKIIVPKDGIGSAFEIFKEEVYDRVIKPSSNGIVIDVGAHVGMFSIKWAKVAKIVIAVEPEPTNLGYIKENLNSNKIDNIMVVDEALSNQVGFGSLNQSKQSACHSLVYSVGARHLEVKVDTLDNLLKSISLGNEEIDFIKIDAEGSELQVLEGASKTLERTKKVAVAAYHTLPQGRKEIEEVSSFLAFKGFKIKLDKGLRSYVYASKQTI